MRLRFPERVSIGKVLLLSAATFCVQTIEGTDLRFSGLYFAFILFSALAFNIAGGFSRLIGAYIFWFCTLTTMVGVSWKLVLGEPGQVNLESPYLTMSVYVVSMIMLLLVALVNRQFDARPFSAAVLLKSDQINYTTAGLGCILFAIGENVAGVVFGISQGGVLSALRQLDIFLPLGIILATIGALRDTGGRRSITFVNGFGLTCLFYFGLLSLSKQAMMAGPVCWFVGATFMRMQLRRVHYIAIALVLVVNFEVLTPLSAVRDEIPDTLGPQARLDVIIDKTEHIQQIKARLASDIQDNLSGRGRSYYSTPQNSLIERLSMLSPDDAFFTYASGTEPGGLLPIEHDFQNWLPHWLSPDKINDGGGNHYAHLVGGYLASDDFTTGISFSPLSEMYFLAGWTGILIYLPLIWLMLFTSNDLICGNLRETPWGLLVVVYFAHAAPESLVSGLVYYTWYGNIGLLFGMLFCTRLAPVLGSLFYGQKAKPKPMLRRRQIVVQPS